jgi:hypothetical protein
VLLFATSRAIVTDRAGEVGRCSSVVLFAGSLNFLVPSDTSVTDLKEESSNVQERSRVVTSQ